MKAIEILNINRNPSYIEVTSIMRFPVPAALLNNGLPYEGVADIAQGYGYDIEVVVDSGVSTTYITKTDTMSISGSPSANAFKTALVNRFNTLTTTVAAFTLKPFDTLLSGYYDGTNWIVN